MNAAQNLLSILCHANVVAECAPASPQKSRFIANSSWGQCSGTRRTAAAKLVLHIHALDSGCHQDCGGGHLCFIGLPAALHACPLLLLSCSIPVKTTERYSPSTIELQLLELLEDAVSDPDVVLVAAPSLCRIVQGAPGLALQALDKHDAITMLAYVVKKQQQLDNLKVVPAMQM